MLKTYFKNKIYKKAIYLLFALFFISTAASAYLKYGTYTDAIRAIDIYEAPTNDRFCQSLAINYKSFALYEKDFMSDPRDAEYFARKAILAYNGERIPPETLKNRRIPLEHIIDADKGYDDLQYMLSKDVIEEFPMLVAEAQSKFDCWLEQMEENNQPRHIENCGERFKKAIDILYSKLDQECTKCSHQLEKEKQARAEDAKKSPINDFDGKMPQIPVWSISARLQERPPTAYEVNIPTTIASGTPDLSEDMRLTQEQMDKIKKELAELNKTMAELAKQKPAVSQSDLTKKDLENLENEVKELRKSVDGIEPCCEAPVIEVKDKEYEKVEQNQDMLTFPIEIFFDWDSDKVDSKFNTVVEQIAKVLLTNNETGLVLEGHADTSGPKQYNIGLSKRRAENMKKTLQTYGIVADRFTIVPKGETDLKVSTPDGIKEAANRRVKIIKINK